LATSSNEPRMPSNKKLIYFKTETSEIHTRKFKFPDPAIQGLYLVATQAKHSRTSRITKTELKKSLSMRTLPILIAT